jgi:hypothetical protein
VRCITGFLAFLLLALAAALVLAQPPPERERPQPPATENNPDSHARLAQWFLDSAGRHACFSDKHCFCIRFISFQGVPAADLPEWKRATAAWLNFMSFQTSPSVPLDVPGSDGRLQWIDLRWFHWNSPAFQAVAERDRTFREPWVRHDVAESLRETIAVRPKKHFAYCPAEAIVWGPQLFRDTMETDRTSSYYDLLFSRQRFGDVDWWAGGIDPDDGKDYRRGWYFGKTKRGFVDADFPRNENDWRAAFGIDVQKAFAAKQELLLQFGAVVEGGRDNPLGGSIVALNNRLLVDTPGVLHGMQSFDVFVTSGKRNFLAQSPNLPVVLRANKDDKIAYDASELLNYLPNGSQAAFLTDGKGKRAEIAANKAASAANIDKRLNAGVRNPGDCMLCHAPQGGYIPPTNLVEKVLDGGLNVHFKDGQDALDYRNFFVGWLKRIKSHREPFADLVAETTRGRPPAAAEWETADPAKLRALLARAEAARQVKGWTGAEWAGALQRRRNAYDDPVTPATAAAELGVDVGTLKRLCNSVEDYSKKKEYEDFAAQTFDAGRLVLDTTIPRSVWDGDLFPVLGVILATERDKK